jgi:hypothetical protein
MPPKASHAPKNFQRRKLFSAVAVIVVVPVHAVDAVVIEIGPPIERFMIWATFSLVGHTTFS